MMDLFNRTAYASSRIVTSTYSTSFTLGIRTLHARLRNPIYAIYGMVRYADEIVDTFHGFDKATLLKRFEADTLQALEEGISLNPVLQAFQDTVHKYGIDRELILAFFNSMEMDLEKKVYDDSTYQEYIYGSAEVVGLMCLRVFAENDDALFDRLKHPARKLGAAFQKINFLRDIQNDFMDRGRIYFPGVDFNHFTQEAKLQIEADIRNDFEEALIGINALPPSSKNGVYLAYKFYTKLLDRIVATPASRIQHTRIRVPDYQKAGLMINALLSIN
jgi:hypothetical protein